MTGDLIQAVTFDRLNPKTQDTHSTVAGQNCFENSVFKKIR